MEEGRALSHLFPGLWPLPHTHHVVAPLEVTGGRVCLRFPPARRLLNPELQVHGQAVLVQGVDLHKNKAAACYRCVPEGHMLEMFLLAQEEKVPESPTTKASDCHPHSEARGGSALRGSRDFTETAEPGCGCPDSKLILMASLYSGSSLFTNSVLANFLKCVFNPKSFLGVVTATPGHTLSSEELERPDAHAPAQGQTR